MRKLEIRFGDAIARLGPAYLPLEILSTEGRRIVRQAVRVDMAIRLDLDEKVVILRAYLPSGQVIDSQVELNAKHLNQVTLKAYPESPSAQLDWAYFTEPLHRYPIPERQWPDIREMNLWVNQADGTWLQLESVLDSFDFTPNEQSVEFLAIGILDVDRGRYWLQVGGLGFSNKFLALLPSYRQQIVILAQEGTPFETSPIRIIINPLEPASETLLSFLTRGHHEFARLVGAAAFEDQDVFAAAVKESESSAVIWGYFALRMGGRIEDGLIEMLISSDFVSPDHLVILAWHAMRSDRPDFRFAKQKLIQAARLGSPLCTEGVRLLYDGLTLLSLRRRSSDHELSAAIEKTRLIAASCDWRATTTTLSPDNLPWGSQPGIALPITTAPVLISPSDLAHAIEEESDEQGNQKKREEESPLETA